jgi:CIC family chloride channel protein
MALSTAPLRSGLLLRRARFSFAALQRGFRDIELMQILVCGLLGAFTGAVVDILRQGVFLLHQADFGISGDHFLSEGVGVSRLRLLVVPLLGGLFLGLCARAVRTRISDIVDPIEANALHGGRMSLKDSLWLTFTTLLSNASGASLGMEAGYSQLGAGLYSALGRWFRLRRADLRIFVTAGAAAAIAAAFNAPLAGAFYGYELILGSYTARALAPVIVASVCAALTQRSMSHMKALFEVGGGFSVTSGSYLLFALMGVAAAAVAVAAMQAVTWIERSLRHTKLPDWLRPALGGAALTLLALIAPQVLGSGHGAVQVIFDSHPGLTALLLLLALKLLASALSVGAGFRGGLFSSALFLGTLLGAAFAAILFHFAPALAPERPVFLLAGMGAVGGAIIGGPLTMVFLVLEGTGDFQATVAVVIAVTVAASLVRIFFGFSFATWRFHLRGLSIRGAHDVGWTREMNAGKLMRTDAKTVPVNLGLRALRAAFPPGAAKRLFVLDGEGQYAGTIDIDDLHDAEIDDALDGAVAGDLATGAENFLLPSDDVRSLLARFDALQSEALPVLASTVQRRVVGYVTEAYALKRYSQELERMRGAELGQQDLFSIGPKP